MENCGRLNIISKSLDAGFAEFLRQATVRCQYLSKLIYTHSLFLVILGLITVCVYVLSMKKNREIK